MARVTRFAGVEGNKRRPRPGEGSVSVTADGLEIRREPESRATWRGHIAQNPLAWQRAQVAHVYLSPRERVELACALLDTIILTTEEAVKDFRDE